MRLSPELKFISNILGSSLRPNHTPGDGKASPVKNINWARLIPLTNHHRVGGLLFYWMRNLKLENSVPLRVYKNLKDIYESYSNVWENHGQVLKKILMGCHEREVDVMMLKGAQIAHTDYPDFSLRPIDDIDLLVRQPDRSKVIKFMLEMGFNLYETNQTCDKFFVRNRQPGKPIFIEIHSSLQTRIRLNRAFNIDINQFWKGAQEFTADGYSFVQLSPTDNLIYLGAHFSHHHFSRLIWAYDIALLIHRHREEVDWEKLKDLCGRMKIRNPLYHSLRLCRELFGIPISEEVLRDLSPSWWKRRIGHFLIRGNLLFPEQSRGNRFKQILIKMFLVDSWVEAILWCLFPTKEWIKQRYCLQNTREIYTYYLLHPLLYLIKAMKAPMR